TRKDNVAPDTAKQLAEPSHVTLQHILVSFDGSSLNKRVGREQAAAEALAKEVFTQAQSGADFEALVKKYTDDQAPGIYKLSNHGVASRDGEMRREDMVAGFGNIGFSLGIGQVGFVPYDEANSPLGWHVIKRLN